MKKHNSFLVIISLSIVALILVSTLNSVVDPYFHFHKPINYLEYKINNQRYQNDGILRHFSYDAIIIGSSMTENFKTSEFDQLFNVNSVKVPFSGSSLKETNDRLKRAFSSSNKIKKVVRCIDYSKMIFPSDLFSYEGMPTYLYDDDIVNDINYLLNGEVFVEGSLRDIFFTLGGGKTKSFDDYCNWMSSHEFGKTSVLSKYERPDTSSQLLSLTNEEIKIQNQNIIDNVITIANENPNTEFYLFFPPYSICYFDEISRKGELKRFLESEKEAIELLVKVKNIKLFCFLDDYEIICNLDNYTDYVHYSENINSYILKCMANNEHHITYDNYVEYCDKVSQFYTTYDYDSIFN